MFDIIICCIIFHHIICLYWYIEHYMYTLLNYNKLMINEKPCMAIIFWIAIFFPDFFIWVFLLRSHVFLYWMSYWHQHTSILHIRMRRMCCCVPIINFLCNLEFSESRGQYIATQTNIKTIDTNRKIRYRKCQCIHKHTHTVNGLLFVREFLEWN